MPWIAAGKQNDPLCQDRNVVTMWKQPAFNDTGQHDRRSFRCGPTRQIKSAV